MVTPGQMQMFNKPEPYEAQILGSKYVNQYEYDPSSDVPNAGTYTIRLHDHTLGNALRMELYEHTLGNALLKDGKGFYSVKFTLPIDGGGSYYTSYRWRRLLSDGHKVLVLRKLCL
ncbi:unnamed protein product [Amoebophrya sp. A25]|nr:unnamed protein product [Amoebophrya sp. A25]|eukprot:GSA25T00027977001.1